MAVGYQQYRYQMFLRKENMIPGACLLVVYIKVGGQRTWK